MSTHELEVSCRASELHRRWSQPGQAPRTTMSYRHTNTEYLRVLIALLAPAHRLGLTSKAYHLPLTADAEEMATENTELLRLGGVRKEFLSGQHWWHCVSSRQCQPQSSTTSSIGNNPVCGWVHEISGCLGIGGDPRSQLIGLTSRGWGARPRSMQLPVGLYLQWPHTSESPQGD